MGGCRLFCSALPVRRTQYLAATRSSSPEVGNGQSWPKPQCTCILAMPWLLARHSTKVGVCTIRSNSACSMLISNDLAAAEMRTQTLQPTGSEKSDLALNHGPPRSPGFNSYLVLPGFTRCSQLAFMDWMAISRKSS